MRGSLIFVVALIVAASSLPAQDAGPPIANLRGAAPLAEDTAAPRMARTEDGAARRVRNYPEQPPTIPHDIEGYQVDRNANKCLSCHARTRTGESGAPMISVTHFMDRDGQFLAAVSPRRYFCTQCHVTQQDVKEMVGNSFKDVDSLLTPNGNSN